MKKFLKRFWLVLLGLVVVGIAWLVGLSEPVWAGVIVVVLILAFQDA